MSAWVSTRLVALSPKLSLCASCSISLHLLAKGQHGRIDGQVAVVNGCGGLRQMCLDAAPLLYFTVVLAGEGLSMLARWRLVETPEPNAWQVFLSSLSPEL